MKKNTFCLFIFLFIPLISIAGENVKKLEQAQNTGKYTLIFLYKKGDSQSTKMENVFDKAVAQLPEAIPIKVDINDQSENALIDKFELKSAPTPFVLVVGPTGAVTGGFPCTFTEQDIANAFVSSATEKTLKALQERKLVILIIQNKATLHNEEALEGVEGLKADPKFSQATVLVTLDPSDPREAKFLSQFKVDPATQEATTILLTPPGNLIGKYEGATNKQQFVNALESAASGCCGPGGCPGGRCGPKK